MDDERRHEERVKHPRVCVACAPVQWSSRLGSPNVARTIIDVSTGGARVILSRQLEMGEPVTVRLDGLHNKRSVSLAAEVRWVAPLPSVDGGALAYVAGLKFKRAPGLLDLILTA